MSAPRNPSFGPYPQPSDEWINETILAFGKRLFHLRTVNRVEPLFRCAMNFPKLGKLVYVELMPSLALRVRDHATGAVIVQSMPGGDFDTVDTKAPATIEEAFNAWAASRLTAPTSAGEGGNSDA